MDLGKKMDRARNENVPMDHEIVAPPVARENASMVHADPMANAPKVRARHALLMMRKVMYLHRAILQNIHLPISLPRH
jgi:hypothetical protein